MGNVVTTFTSDIKRLEKAYDDIDKRNRKLEEQLQHVKDKSEQANLKHQQGLEGTVGKVAKLAAGYLSVGAAITAVNDGLRAKQELESKSLNTQLSVADAQIKALRNLGVVSDQQRQKFNADIAGISKGTGMSQRDLFLAASSSLSAKGNLSIDSALDAVRMAATVAPESGEEATEISGALLDLAKATGSTDTKENLGFLLGIGQKARVTNLSALSSNLVPGIIGVKGFGGEAKDAGALVAAITAGAGDAQGAKSANAAIRLAEQLSDFLPDQDRFTFDAQGNKTLARKGTGINNTAERIQFLRDNAAEREQFLAGMSMDAKAIIPVRQILTGGLTGSIYDDFRKEIATGQAAAQITDQTIAGIRSVPLQQTAQSVRMNAAGLEGLQVADRKGAIAANIRENYDENLQRAGVGYLDRKFMGAAFEVEAGLGLSDPVDVWERQLQIQKKNQEGYANLAAFQGQDNSQQLKHLEVLNQLLEQIKGMRGDIKTPVPAINNHTE